MLAILIKLIVTQPKSLLTHAANYVDLMFEELQRARLRWRLWLLLQALSAACLVLSLFAATGALLLWGALPVLHPQNAWILVTLPAVLLVVSLGFHEAAKYQRTQTCFEDIQQQLKLDLLAICEAQDHDPRTAARR